MATKQEGFLSIKLNPVLKNNFKAACSTNGKTMKQVLVEYMKMYIEIANNKKSL